MSDSSEKKSLELQDQSRISPKSERGLPERSPRAVADTVVQARNGATETAERTGAAAAATMRHIGEAAIAAGHKNLDKMTEATQAVAEAVPGQTRAAATEWQQTAHKLLEAAQSTAKDIRALMVLPHQPGGHVHEIQQAMGNLVSGMVQGQFNAAQDMFRFADAGTILHLQQHFVRTYLDTLMQGSAIIVQSARASLRPAGQDQSHHAGENRHHRVGDVMQRDVRIASPDDTVQHAARLMREADTGALPVGDADHLVGMVTDHELALCLAADGRDPTRTKVREVMTSEVPFVFEDDDIGDLADIMAEKQVRRLTVLDREKRVVGVVTLADVAAKRGRPAPGAASARQTQAA